MVVDDSLGYANLRFVDVDVSTSILPHGSFDFPNYFARYVGPEVFGNENFCTWPMASGFCLSEGNFGWFEGTFDGSALNMSGSDPINFFSSHQHINTQSTQWQLLIVLQRFQSPPLSY